MRTPSIGGGRPARDPRAQGEQGEPRGVDVEHGAADQAADGDQRERHQEPGGQQRGERADRVRGDLGVEVLVGAGEQQAPEHEHDRREAAAERRPADDAAADGDRGRYRE